MSASVDVRCGREGRCGQTGARDESQLEPAGGYVFFLFLQYILRAQTTSPLFGPRFFFLIN